eukprot:gene344-977_t
MVPSEEDEKFLLVKLDVVKEIRSKTLHLEKVKARIFHELQLIKKEDQNLTDYKTEIDNLRRERLMHIESLRLIERDISVIENSITEIQQERDKIQQRTCDLFQEYNPLKREIDIQRTQIGLEELNELPCKDQFCQESVSWQSMKPSQETTSSLSLVCATQPILLPPSCNIASHSSPSQSSTSQPSKCEAAASRRPRRQQPPPMKTCSTCQELIHRNAPVCPMCKSKSTSRNSKKSKRMHEEGRPLS